MIMIFHVGSVGQSVDTAWILNSWDISWLVSSVERCLKCQNLHVNWAWPYKTAMKILVFCYLANVFFPWKCHSSLKECYAYTFPYFLLLVRLSRNGHEITLLWIYTTSCKKWGLFSKWINVRMESNNFLFLCDFESWQRPNFWASESPLEGCFCR